MPKITLVNSQPRLLVNSGVRIMPGVKEYDLDDKKIQELLSNEQFQSWQHLGWVKRKIKSVAPPPAPAAPEVEAEEPAPPPPPADPALALQGVNLPEAEDMIAACEDPELLAEWYDKDDRKGARQAIEDRMQQLDALE